MGNEPKKALIYSMDFDLSNKYLKVIIQFLEVKLLNEKGEVLFYFFIL